MGLTGICLYSYSSVQLHKKWSSELFSENDSYSYIKKWFSNSNPKGPKIEKIQDRPPGLKFSIEIEIFKRATHQTLIFVGNSEGPGLKISSEIEIFNRD